MEYLNTCAVGIDGPVKNHTANPIREHRGEGLTKEGPITDSPVIQKMWLLTSFTVSALGKSILNRYHVSGNCRGGHMLSSIIDTANGVVVIFTKLSRPTKVTKQ